MTATVCVKNTVVCWISPYKYKEMKSRDFLVVLILLAILGSCIQDAGAKNTKKDKKPKKKAPGNLDSKLTSGSIVISGVGPSRETDVDHMARLMPPELFGAAGRPQLPADFKMKKRKSKPKKAKMKLRKVARPAGDGTTYIVKMKDYLDLDQTANMLDVKVKGYSKAKKAKKVPKLKKKKKVGKHKFVTMEAEFSAIEELAFDNAVDYIEQNGVIEASAWCDDRGLTGIGSWAMDRLDKRAYGLDNKFKSIGNDGHNTYVYVIDSGIRASHSQFEGRVIAGDVFVKEDSGETTPSTEDNYGHGTLVASLVGGKHYGVAPGTMLVSVKVLNSHGTGTIDGLVDAIGFAVEDCANRTAVTGRCIINLSVSAPFVSNLIGDALEAAENASIVVVGAAGNNKADACDTTPGYSEHVVAVGASGPYDVFAASFSNYGPCVDIIAPGSKIVGAGTATDYAIRQDNGTSFSSPFTAGVCALYLSVVDYATVADVKSFLINWGTSNKISGLPSDTINTVLYLGCSYL
ncbi:subtilisin-like protease 4 isoform X2 [Lingula anatina]|uniref:Subtilisin-like protease 4 isoform X2 n=1 Tax=Lingula anatina TaxID=7574 RepID=A0A1S3JPX7_LINAN|nr:subtilisin-like protease 4 isoform X2 [Lingula anatina]|eukprot:XP_013412407.1 subtilisin-like protease 4 isoform X2 [Lingula anatina]